MIVEPNGIADQVRYCIGAAMAPMSEMGHNRHRQTAVWFWAKCDPAMSHLATKGSQRVPRRTNPRSATALNHRGRYSCDVALAITSKKLKADAVGYVEGKLGVAAKPVRLIETPAINLDVGLIEEANCPRTGLVRLVVLGPIRVVTASCISRDDFAAADIAGFAQSTWRRFRGVFDEAGIPREFVLWLSPIPARTEVAADLVAGGRRDLYLTN